MSALIALALLAVPCLSVVGPIGSAKALAYHSDQNPVHAASRQERLVAHYHAAHGTAQPGAPASDFAACCCACDRWIANGIAGETLSAKRVPISPSPDNAKMALAVALAPPMGLPPDRWRPSGTALNPTGRKNAPLYAFTGRIRL